MNEESRRHPRRNAQRWTGLAVLAAALILVCFFPELFGEARGSGGPIAASAAGKGDAVHFIDVGQGDASLIESGGEYVLIDGGTGLAEDALVSYLKNLKVERLRAVIATHPHEDHIGGLDKVLSSFPTDAFYMPGRSAATACFERMLDAVDAQQLEVTIPEPGDRLSFGNGVLEFLSPALENSYEETNDFSIVTKLTIGDFTVLFMGDAGKTVERDLLRSGFNLDCDIIKLGHHGSSSASAESFLRAASPKTAIISCAGENDYGHPHRETLETLNKLKIDCLCTYDGTITLPAQTEDAA